MRFGIDLGWIFGASKPEKSINIIGFSMVFVNFQKIDVFALSPKVNQKIIEKSIQKSTKNKKKR